MSTAYDYDAWKCHDELAEQREQQDMADEELKLKAEEAMDIFQERGHLPGGYDSGDVDAAMLEEMPNLIHEFTKRKSRFELLVHAQRVADLREKIALDMATEGLKKERCESTSGGRRYE